MVDTPTLLALLQRHYIKPGADLPGGVFLPEVGWNPAGGGGCDAIYVGFTGSSGRMLVGHELKVSRADWLNELNKPGKADAWADQCHEWWLVVNDPAIVHTGELPAGWGLMSPGRSKTRMTVHTPAERKARTHTPSWHAVRSILARQDTLRAQAITDGRQAVYERVRAENEPRIEAEIERRTRHVPDVADLRAKLKTVEDALGGPIDFSDNDWIAPGHIDLDSLSQIGAAARALGDVQRAARQIVGRYGNPFVQTRKALDRLDQALVELEKVGPQ